MTRKDAIETLEDLKFNAAKFGEYYERKKESCELTFRYSPQFVACLNIALTDLKNLDTINEDVNQLRVKAMIDGHDNEYMKAYTSGLYDVLDLVLGREQWTRH